MELGSRQVTDTLLAELRRGRWRPRVWRRFWRAALARSAQQALAHPRAAAELTVLHTAVLALSRGRGRAWIATSWLMCVTHLGLLEDRSSIGPANVVTLVRANLPVVGDVLGPRLGAVALVSDVVDGRLARRRGPTRFGAYADALADAAFWTWFAAHHEPGRWPRFVAYLAWAGPPSVIVTMSVVRGRMVEPPRPALLRPAAMLQVVLAVRGLRAQRRG